MSQWSDEPDALDPFARPLTHITNWPQDTPPAAVADLARRNHELRIAVIRLEDETIELRRELAATRAVLAGRPRKAPIWWLPFAYVGLAWGAGCGTYSYEPEEKTR